MMINRSKIGVSMFGCSLMVLLTVFCSINVQLAGGRKCVCTSKACKESGVATCKTKYSCYAELIVNTDQEIGENSTTRGCTEGPTPLLCETKSWVTRSKSSESVLRSSAPWIRMGWSRLKCCDSHDYCNSDHHVNVSTWILEAERAYSPEPTLHYNGSVDVSSGSGTMGSIQPDPGPIIEGQESSDQLLQHRVRPLHLATMILAIAALISVLAACYVITRVMSGHYRLGAQPQDRIHHSLKSHQGYEAQEA